MFFLSEPVEGGGILRDHLRQLELSGREVPELHPDPPPPEAAHVFYYWQDMSSMRSSGGFGPGVLEPQTIVGWQQLRGIFLMPVELDMLFAIEKAYRSSISERMRKKT